MRFGTTTLTQTNQGSGADQRIKKTETAGTSPADVVEYFYYTYCANNPVKYSDPSGHFIHIAIAIGFALWSAYDYYKEYKHAKKQGKSGWKLVKHMGGFVAKDLAFGKVKKAKKVGKAVLKTAKKVYKSKVIQRAIKKTYKSSHGRHIVTHKISHTNKNRRSTNKLRPDPEAKGAPHSTYKTDKQTGRITNYETYRSNPRNPNGVELFKRYDEIGKPHYNKVTKRKVYTPHVHTKRAAGGVRGAYRYEIPRR